MRLPKTAALLEEVKKEIGQPINVPKKFYQRKRPYEIEANLLVGKPEDSFSYPSGHAARGMVYALVLAELFPTHREAILKVGYDIGWGRVVLGKHFPSDIYAGRVLGKSIAQELLTSPAFQRDLAKAKDEVALAMPASGGTAVPKQ